MKIYYEFLVWEVFEEQEPEPFGNQFFQGVPKVGEVVTLYWSSKEIAYQKKVTRVDLERKELFVECIK